MRCTKNCLHNFANQMHKRKSMSGIEWILIR
jgi:hypothetical protein